MPKSAHDPAHDPVTGDALTPGEQVSWRIQGVIRNWNFLIAVLLITAVCWATDNSAVLLWWNLSASLLAIVIESIVGLAMFGQTRRDAVVLREVRANTQQSKQLEQRLLALEETILSRLVV